MMEDYDPETTGFGSARYGEALRRLRDHGVRDVNIGYREELGYWVATRRAPRVHSGYHKDPATAIEALLEMIKTR